MDLDWCSEEDIANTTAFNDNSIISSKTKKVVEPVNEQIISKKEEIDITKCFEVKIDCSSQKELILVLNYLSAVSNHLRTMVRNKTSKTTDKNTTNLVSTISTEEFNTIIKYQNWLIDASNKIKNFFGVPFRRDNSYDPTSVKPFKTSSYKFCNFKESCSIHKNKNKNCDKNHFVFEMIINDITKLKESLLIIGLDNLNYILSGKNIKVIYNSEQQNYIIDTDNLDLTDIDTEFIIDKSLIFKSFDVSSYVLNKMFDEANCFLSFGLPSLQITI